MALFEHLQLQIKYENMLTIMISWDFSHGYKKHVKFIQENGMVQGSEHI